MSYYYYYMSVLERFLFSRIQALYYVLACRLILNCNAYVVCSEYGWFPLVWVLLPLGPSRAYHRAMPGDNTYGLSRVLIPGTCLRGII